MEINLTDSTVERVQAFVACTRGATADDVINQALDCFEKQRRPSANVARQDAEAVVHRFRKYRGMLAGVTVNDVVAWRHKGLR